jgi:hypothetical protein
MVTIHNLEVRFDVEGEGDEAVFSRLFAKHARAWQRQLADAERRARESEKDRSLGDRPQAGGDG